MPSKSDMEQDFSPQVEVAIPLARTLALQKGNIQEAIENLLSLEKQTRQGNDIPSTSKLTTEIVRICYEAKNFKLLNDQLMILSKRRGQHKQAVQAMVQEAMKFLNQIFELEVKLELLETLRTITEGKIYVENERARVIKTFAQIREDQGKIKEAADILQDVQVETYGSMEKREKTEFILEQTRLCLDANEFIRAQIVAKKINPKLLLDKDLQDLKLRYYTLMIRYYLHNKQYLEVFRSYQHIYNTPSTSVDPQQWSEVLKKMVVFLILSPHSPEQSDLLLRLNSEKNLSDLPLYKQMCQQFCTAEIIEWRVFQLRYEPEFVQLCAADQNRSLNASLFEIFKTRVVEHNIRVIAKYYARIRMSRLSNLLELSVEEAERFLSETVVNGEVYAKINRPQGIVVFRKPLQPSELLNNWANSVDTVLSLVEATCHHIHRERMVHLETKQQNALQQPSQTSAQEQ
eukprot:TRINITY_DN3481_c0_g2_i1.p1 TRINITY_DN3481_c0_g2~~TRINITY_DN3481_c0_g2_i1.p1  ORF type:complete len:460 (-),score=117.69 TRINITY_DN3481_c0_g2_i1:110-1489(-)